MASDSFSPHSFMWVISHINYGDSASTEKGSDLLKVLINCSLIDWFAHFTNIKKNAYLVPGAVCKAQAKQINKAQSMPPGRWQVKQIFAIQCGESIDVPQRGAEMLSVGGGGERRRSGSEEIYELKPEE